MGNEKIKQWMHDSLNTEWPPFMPDGYSQYAPNAIGRDADGKRVEIGSICLGFDRPAGFTVEIRHGFPCRGRVYVDANQGLHEAKPGYKLENPPAFDTLEEAVAVANTALTMIKQRYVRRAGVNLETGAEDWSK